MLSVVQNTVSYEQMIGERWIGKDVEEISHDLIQILSQQLPGGTEENQEKSQDS
jgi:hypothetical protein